MFVEACRQNIRTNDHANATARRRIVNGLVTAKTMIADIMRGERPQAFVECIA